MDDREKARVVVGRNLVESPCRLGLRVAVGVGAADEPEHRRDMPFGAERPEILARRRRPGLDYPLGAEMSAEGITDTPARVRIVRDEGVTIKWRDLRRPGSP